MNENQNGSGNLLDTTDCLEAVGVFKGWKNFFFIIIVLCILLIQACFWLTDLGFIGIDQEANASQTPALQENMPIPEVNEPAEAPEQEQTETPEEPNEPNVSIDTSGHNFPILLASETTVDNSEDAEEDTEEAETESDGFLFGITFNHLVWVMRIANPVLILVAVLYCLTMIFSLKVSMLGRLGGINHITRAFFLSLIVLILIIPWQRIFDGMILGAVFTSDELIKGYSEKTSDMLDIILYYMRFCGYMVLAFLLLILAQIRSSRWSKAILRRLEII